MNRLLWPDVERCRGLSPHQREQLARALSGRLGLLLGTPGTGKTYTTAALVHVLAEDYGLRDIAVCAPTGKAAVRVTDSLWKAGVQLRATTIHQLLGIGRNGHDGEGWGFEYGEGNPLSQRFVIVDEASMVDTDLAASLFAALGPRMHLLFVGDPYQLPPVGHGAPLRDLIAAGVPQGELTEIQRNAGLIVRACAAIKGGQPYETCDSYEPEGGLNLRHIEEETAEKQLTALSSLFHKIAGDSRWKWNPVWDVQVLCALNDKGPLARQEINRILQAQLNPHGGGNPEHRFKTGDKVICLRNHAAQDADNAHAEAHYLANGEIGAVKNAEAAHRLILEFYAPLRIVSVPVSKKKTAEGEETDAAARGDFDLAYAVTVHKAQGSEWPVILVLLDGSAGARRLCSREWLYTGISRASQLCITIGRSSVAHLIARRPALEQRKTLLADLIRNGET